MVFTLEEKVKNILNQYDPIGLIKIGCPNDEYEPEIRKIMPLLRTALTRERFRDEVYLIFVEMFDKKIAGQKKNYQKLSQEIYKLKNKVGTS